MVDNLSIDFLWHSLVKASVSSFHVKDRNLPSFRRECRQATIGVTEHQHRIEAFCFEKLIKFGDRVPDRVRSGLSGCVQEHIGASDLHVLKEYLV
jgi:hypothetical protein